MVLSTFIMLYSHHQQTSPYPHLVKLYQTVTPNSSSLQPLTTHGLLSVCLCGFDFLSGITHSICPFVIGLLHLASGLQGAFTLCQNAFPIQA